jgi:hypothetical protein
MTIFLKVCQELLPDYLRVISERSTAADQSLTNTMLSKIGFGRDLELSASKREILENLLKALQTFTDDTDDSRTYTALTTLVDSSRYQAREASDARKLNEGTFGPEMHSVVALLSEVYTTIDKLRLLNIKDSADPSFTFYYYLALYDTKKVADAHFESVVARMAKKTLLFTPSELSLEKGKIVQDAREECEKKLSWLNQALPNLSECQYVIVIEMIDKVILNNQELCRKHDPSITLGKQLEFKIPVLGPSHGFLNTCMQQAKSAIEAAELSRQALRKPSGVSSLMAPLVSQHKAEVASSDPLAEGEAAATFPSTLTASESVPSHSIDIPLRASPQPGLVSPMSMFQPAAQDEPNADKKPRKPKSRKE